MADINLLLENSLCFIKLTKGNKNDIFKNLVDELNRNNKLHNAPGFQSDILSREEIATTFMENSVAIPHAKSSHVKEPSICLGVCDDEISNDGTPPLGAKIFFMLALPKNAGDEHLEIISQLAQYIINENFCSELLSVKNKNEVIDLFKSYSNNKNDIMENESYYDIVAITACPVGIAHTYISAEKLEKAAKEKNLKIKIQTNGSIGIKNELSQQDIKNAKAVILAIDIDIDESMFNGKFVTKVPVAYAINKTNDLIDKALKNNTTYELKNLSNSTPSGMTNAFSGYKHLLNGVSFMIPFIVVGGVLIAIAIAFSGVGEGGVIINNPILKILESIGGMSLSLMVPILAGYIGFSISGKPALAPSMIGGLLANSMQAGFLGGILIGFASGYFVKWLVSFKLPRTIETIMPVLIIPLWGTIFVVLIMYSIGSYISLIMESLTNGLKNMQSQGSIVLSSLLGLMIAFDMGGPVNKVAFLFGVSMIGAGVPTIMGPIAAAICTPPLTMALATTINPKLYTTEEKQAGKASFLMGLIGITEGAIPFAASDPLRVIPSIMLASAISAGISGLFRVADYAPHGGLIVLPVIDGKIAFIISIIIGCIVGALCVNLLKTYKSKDL